MAERIVLKKLECPSCGASLKAGNLKDPITCVHCENTFIPEEEVRTAPRNESVSGGGVGGILKVEGMRTPSSALAYIELLFEEYDWESFAYAQTLSIAELDKLADSLKVTSADDKNTWIACFKTIFVPFAHKIAGCKQILTSVIEEYKNDNLDAYSKFDAYKRVAAMVTVRKNRILEKLEKILAKAAKYGASDEEVSNLKADVDTIRNAAAVSVYNNIEEIAEIKAYNDRKNAKIVEELAAEGINAEAAYSQAKALLAQKNYVGALNILLSLRGYSDTKTLADKIDKYFLISDVVEIEGNLYYYKDRNAEEETFDLHPTVNGKIAEKPIIKNMGKIITNYADILYYLDGNGKLKKYNLSSREETKIFDKALQKRLFVYGRKIFALANKDGDFGENGRFDVIALDVKTGVVTTVLTDINGIVALYGNKMIYTMTRKVAQGEDVNTYKTFTNILNVDTMVTVGLGTRKVNVEGFGENYVVFTRVSPNNYNRNLYIKPLDKEAPEKLIEKNIFKFCAIIKDKLFYYIGNSRNQTLININRDGTGRREWQSFISSVLLEQGGWVYFIRRSGYNSVLCKSRLDGSQYSVVASDIDTFIRIKNGYLYYVNDEAALVKVRMDGTNWQKLCDDVETVLTIREDKVVFVSVDDRITVNNYEQITTQKVKSIYAVDFSGSGKIKLAYNIINAKYYDENTIYYVDAKDTVVSSAGVDSMETTRTLYRLDVDAVNEVKLLEMAVEAEEKSVSGFTIAMIIMSLAFFFALMGFAGEAGGFAAFCMVAGVISGIVGLGLKFSD